MSIFQGVAKDNKKILMMADKAGFWGEEKAPPP